MAKRPGLTIPQSIKALREADPLLAIRIDQLPIRARSKRILLAYASGFTLKEIGQHYNISSQRVSTICKDISKHWG